MKPKPTPKRELTVAWHNDRVRTIAVRLASDDALQWFLGEALTYGILGNEVGGKHYLTVYDEYDFAEVLAYLESYNDEEVQP
jgi:hypothetical protein